MIAAALEDRAGKNRKRSPHRSPGVAEPALNLRARERNHRGVLELDRRTEQSHLQRRRVFLVAEQKVGDAQGKCVGSPGGGHAEVRVSVSAEVLHRRHQAGINDSQRHEPISGSPMSLPLAH